MYTMADVAEDYRNGFIADLQKGWHSRKSRDLLMEGADKKNQSNPAFTCYLGICAA